MVLAYDRAAHAQAARAATDAVAARVQAVLGQRLAAVVAGVRDAKAVGQWAAGTRAPHPAAERRLRDAFQVIELLVQYDAPEVVRAWFGGMNPDLEDRPPALVIGDDPQRVLQAAKTFAAHG